MLKRQNRLSTEEFTKVIEKGRIIHSPLFIVRVLVERDSGSDKNSGSSIHIAAVAPKKVAPTAVLRNAIRRRIYEAVATLNISSVPFSQKVIVFAKNEAIMKSSFKEVQGDLQTLFKKSKIIE